MKKKIIHLLALVLLTVGLYSCYPGGSEFVADTDIVITSFNDTYDFGGIQTYYLADSINHIYEEGDEPSYKYDALIIAELEANLNKQGYQRLDSVDIENGVDPDVAIVVSLLVVENYNVYGYPWYPGWGWGYYYKDTDYWGYPGYGWGYYPYYPIYVSSYKIGTIVWRMFDPENVDEDEQVIYVEWTGALNGILGTSTSETKSRISRGIEQAFDQSPYLNSSK